MTRFITLALAATMALAACDVVAGLLRAHQIHRAVGDNAIQPGAEVRARFEASELLVGANERFLNNILSILFVACHPKCEPKDASAVTLHERTKRIAVALAGTGQDGCCFGGVHLNSLDGQRRSGVSRLNAAIASVALRYRAVL